MRVSGRPTSVAASSNASHWTVRRPCQPERAAELIELDDAMGALEKINPRGCKVVELRYFGGMNNKEAAEVLRISETTVERDWRLAKAWLYRELQAR